MTNDPQKSDLLILAMKSANKPEGSGAESMERRGRAEGETHTRRAQDRENVTTGLDRVRERAKRRKKEKFTTLLHYVEAEIPSGAPDHVVRTVTENARTLRFKTQGFEKE